MEEVEDCEPDVGLGNGGLGRLAACFMDSMANLGVAATGYGIRYNYGVFQQKIINSWQYEEPDDWLCFGNPWERVRQGISYPVKYRGRVEIHGGRRVWTDAEMVYAVPYDMPIPGYRCNVCCTLRLWGCKAPKTFDLPSYNTGSFIEAVLKRNMCENITTMLYPYDHTIEGKKLRLKQEYLLVSASCQDILRRFQLIDENGPRRQDFRELPDKIVIHLNDSHLALAIPEMMRLLVDVEGVGWDEAWKIVQQCISFTSQTVLPTTQERWPVSLLRSLLPRHLEIIYKINQDFIDMLIDKYPDDKEKAKKMSVFQSDTGHEMFISAHLCIIGSHIINGVSEMHTHAMKEILYNDFYQLWPTKFQSITSGVSPRRWIKLCNPTLSNLLTEKLGEDWVINLEKLKGLKKFAKDETFLKNFISIKFQNKVRLANYIFHTLNVEVNPNTLFDVQVKPIHEYRRQLLNILHIIALYNRIKRNPRIDMVPRTVMIGGKGALGYTRAKLIISLINCIAKKVNNDPDANGKLKARKLQKKSNDNLRVMTKISRRICVVVYLTNYGVTMAQYVVPGADISQHISTPGMEASGTGNMKFMMNGVPMLGTIDGTNTELIEEAGQDNNFTFGHTIEDVAEFRRRGSHAVEGEELRAELEVPKLGKFRNIWRKITEKIYDPQAYIGQSPELREALEQIKSGFYNPEDVDRFKVLYKDLTGSDHYLICVDFSKYCKAQAAIEEAFKDKLKWAKMCLMNIVGSTKFSSDRAVKEYARDIWNVPTERLVLPSLTFDPVDPNGEVVKSPSDNNEKIPLPVWYVSRCF
ncbi:unnamed protein product [Rodentolepis nana]|uniref:Alpha-1,4 glucan phosphorylase n=1 Tax=Rodentolepis nana TaxID=102285 RepID=A0A158QJD1_RODNA|nr:unnamed protein product [Rodentolepis nana]